jgi:pantoate--beta-alanine ligase
MPGPGLPRNRAALGFAAMLICRDLDSLRAAVAELRAGGRRLALVPTMGALHEGHLALVRAGRHEADSVAASIFVNPLQFGPNEDLARYPRDEEDDLAKLRAAGCDLAWMPTVELMYPPGAASTIEVGGLSECWEGTHRPGHFRGVATVCAKLFLQTGADVAMFGEKDWQQLQVVRRMVRDLDMPLRIQGVATVREPDGLALSSRNRFLAPEERALAPRLAATMRGVAEALADGTTPAAPALAEAEAAFRRDGFGVDYLALVEAESLRPLAAADRQARLIAAARLGTVRLLDNMPVPLA